MLSQSAFVMAAEITPSEWNGFPQKDLVIEVRPSILVSPHIAAEDKPWIWRTEFFGDTPAVDIALLEQGYHLAYIDMQDMYGSPTSMLIMDKFYEYLTTHDSLSKKCVLEGFSRGGLFALNWAARHPDRVACIYVDAPVCDIKSWPGGKGTSNGSPEDWEKCKAIYGFTTEEQAMSYSHNPVDTETLQPIANHNIPLIAVCGDADLVVPMDENILLLKKRLLELGGQIEIITKPGVGHHPHSLEDPAPIVKFVKNSSQ